MDLMSDPKMPLLATDQILKIPNTSFHRTRAIREERFGYSSMTG